MNNRELAADPPPPPLPPSVRDDLSGPGPPTTHAVEVSPLSSCVFEDGDVDEATFLRKGTKLRKCEYGKNSQIFDMFHDMFVH
jgi:hypothetical protein